MTRLPALNVLYSPRSKQTFCSARGHVRFPPKIDIGGPPSDVRFGSRADMCAAISHVRFTPNSDHESRHAAQAMCWSGVQISHPAPARFTYRRDFPCLSQYRMTRPGRLPASLARSASPHPDVQEAPVKWAKYPSNPARWDLVHALRSVAHYGVCNTSEI
jgi:hypothetical protein